MCSPHIMTGNLKKNCSIPLKTFFKKTLKKLTAWNCENIISTSSWYKANKHTISMICHGMYWSWLICRSISQDSPSSGFDRHEALLPFAGLRWGGLPWHHINSLWYRGNTLRQGSSHSHGRGRTSKTQTASEGLGLKLIMCHFYLILIGENKSCGKAQVWEVNTNWPGWDHSMVWMRGCVRNQG